MRLVCEKCSAVYTIEDTLVGDRDFRVSCKQCGTPIVRRTRADTGAPSSVNQITTATGSTGNTTLSPRPPRPPASFAPTGAEEWFVWLEEGQRGPFQANQVAGLIEQGEMDWATQVWREGFRDWRAARRDATLVTAVAGARGVAGDTMRLSSARSFLAPEDTIVESRADIFSPSQRISFGPKDDLLSSTSDTQAIDARDMTEVEPTVTEASRPNLTPQPPPQQWNTPENAAFRAALGLRSDTMPMKPAVPVPVEANGSAGPTMASAFRSAPSLMRTNTGEVASAPPTDGRDSWLPKPQSLLAVAALAFAGGVLAAAIASRYVAPKHGDAHASATKPAASAPKQSAPAKVVATPQKPPAASAPLTIAPVTAPLRDLPEPEELRGEVRRVAPDVRRCITDPAAGVEVGVFFDGPSGRVRDVHVRSSGLTPGRVDCVIHAVRQMQLAPFRRPELKLPHKFSWQY